ncbi:cyanobacterial hypothetical protein [Leptolyngbya sp. NIES-2104]|nr:cyanobacterial hypothetical protein [Leptolyngbya sp. NIES-2104]
MLLARICEAITRKTDVEVAILSDLQPDSEFFHRNSIIKKVRNHTSIARYQSSIALQFGARSTQIQEKVATQMRQLSSISLVMDLKTILLRDLTISTTNIGLLEFEFGDWAIANWLQTVWESCSIETDFNSAFSPALTLSENSHIFFCQYTYSRCSALLRLTNLPNDIGQTVETWLNDKKLLLRQERSLIEQIISTIDEWEDKPPLESAIALSQTFQNFYQSCQIVKYEAVDRQIAQCRLALVMITHRLLKQLLEQGLGVLAPETL